MWLIALELLPECLLWLLSRRRRRRRLEELNRRDRSAQAALAEAKREAEVSESAGVRARAEAELAVKKHQSVVDEMESVSSAEKLPALGEHAPAVFLVSPEVLPSTPLSVGEQSRSSAYGVLAPSSPDSVDFPPPGLGCREQLEREE